MRLGTVIGRVTMSEQEPILTGARWLIVSPYARENYERGCDGPPTMGKEPSIVVYDSLGASVGQTIGVVEGAEATAPFAVPPPIDAICAALIDEIFYNPMKSSPPTGNNPAGGTNRK